MGHWIDGWYYDDSEVILGPGGRAIVKMPKARQAPAPAAPEPAAVAPASPPAPADERQTTSAPLYTTKVIQPAAPAAPEILTKGGEPNGNANAGQSHGGGAGNGGHAPGAPAKAK